MKDDLIAVAVLWIIVGLISIALGWSTVGVIMAAAGAVGGVALCLMRESQ